MVSSFESSRNDAYFLDEPCNSAFPDVLIISIKLVTYSGTSLLTCPIILLSESSLSTYFFSIFSNATRKRAPADLNYKSNTFAASL